MTIKKISKKEAHGIVDRYCEGKSIDTDKGLFITREKNKFVGIDNTTGDCWVEEFNNSKKCCNWLLDMVK